MFITNDAAVLKPYAPQGTQVKDDFIPSAKVDAYGRISVKLDQVSEVTPVGLPGPALAVQSPRLEALLFDTNRLLARLVSALDDSKLDQDDLYQYLG